MYLKVSINGQIERDYKKYTIIDNFLMFVSCDCVGLIARKKC